MFERLVSFLNSIFSSPREQSIQYWNKRADKYGKQAVININHDAEGFDKITEKQKKLLLPLLKNALRGNEKLILDLGCGPGRFTKNLAELIDGKALGIDPIGRFLALAPKSKNVAFALMENQSIGAKDHSIDVVWICLVLGGIREADLEEIVNEIKRVLVPGGLVFMVENISDKMTTDFWYYRSVSFYESLFPSVQLKQIYSYTDLGEKIAVISGRSYE